MASYQKLVLRFGTTSGEKSFSYNYANDDVDPADVKTAMNTMITNGSIFKYPPMTIISAKVQIQSEYDIDVNS